MSRSHVSLATINFTAIASILALVSCSSPTIEDGEMNWADDVFETEAASGELYRVYAMPGFSCSLTIGERGEDLGLKFVQTRTERGLTTLELYPPVDALDPTIEASFVLSLAKGAEGEAPEVIDDDAQYELAEEPIAGKVLRRYSTTSFEVFEGSSKLFVDRAQGSTGEPFFEVPFEEQALETTLGQFGNCIDWIRSGETGQ